MKLSPLQLLEYFVAEFHFTLNSRFDSGKDMELKLEEMEALPRWERNGNDPRNWTVVLDFKYQPASETNTPYIFSLTLVGMFHVADSYGEQKIEQLVQINGASVLYGIARELIREQTARGPDGPLIIPTASFVNIAGQQKPPEISKPQPTTQPEQGLEKGITGEKLL